MALAPENDYRGAHSAYSWLFAGIMAHPRWYSLWIAEMNATNPQTPVEVAPPTNMFEHMEWDGSRQDLDEDNVINHKVINRITQSMVDSTYPYSLTFINRGIAMDSAHTEFYSGIDQQRHVLLDTYGIPPTIDAHQGWWYPDAQDIEHIHVLRHIQSYENPDKRSYNSRASAACPVYDWFHVGEHYIYEWLSERPPPTDAYSNTSMSGSSSKPCPITISEDMEMDNQVAGTIPIVRSSSAPVVNHQDGVTVEPSSTTAGPIDIDDTHQLAITDSRDRDTNPITVIPDEDMPEDT
ncbi:hypothetical protein IW261DRAFT_1579035 [Armillaria novae-zelandiae]|uniref:Uncharacterized protein n=1 Tax=Armillaria novae-zelandiae TaxID=153914 RepID=A0AA39KDA7_9AGAR|nr:hypothetical protein IW261DRAFT_1579035 [Armillaria novae-zelandiae]